MVKENISVVARVRPLSNETGINEQSCIECDSTNSTITAKDSIYYFNKAFNENATQETIFDNVGQPIVDGFVRGINGAIIGYGQTGSGKTYTMMGPDSNIEDHGIIPRVIERVFELLKAECDEDLKQSKHILKCSFLQIYNEELYDLLQMNKKGLEIQNTSKIITVKGAAEIEVICPDDCINQLQKGLSQRKTAETSMNQESSRSHAVFQLSLKTEYIENGITNTRTSRLNLVDLAGSENAKQTGNTGDRLREAGNINKSVTTLGIVIRQIKKKEKYISYSDSKLTRLLRDSLGGNSKTTVVFNVHSNARYIKQTISTLEFAKSVKVVKNIAKINETFSCEELGTLKNKNKNLLEENDNLKSQISTLSRQNNDLKLVILNDGEKIESFKIDLNKAYDQLKEYQNQSIDSNAALVKELETKTNENEQLLKDKEQMSKEHADTVQELQNKIAKLEEENNQLKVRSTDINEINEELSIIEDGENPEESNDLKTHDGFPCEVHSNGSKKELYIFDSNERKNCYRFKSTEEGFKCYGCKKFVANIRQGKNGVYYVDGSWLHKCKPTEYFKSITTFKFEHPSSLNKLQHPVLYILDEKENNQLECYVLNAISDYYRCQRCERTKNGQGRKTVRAEIWKDKNGEEYVQVSDSHQCEPYKAIKDDNGKITVYGRNVTF